MTKFLFWTVSFLAGALVLAMVWDDINPESRRASSERYEAYKESRKREWRECLLKRPRYECRFMFQENTGAELMIELEEIK